MLLIIDYGLANMKYSLWHENKLLKMSIKERTDKTDYSLERSLAKAYEEYKAFAINYLGVKPNVNPIERTLVIASKHVDHTKTKSFTVESLRDDMKANIKEIIKEKITTTNTTTSLEEDSKKATQKLNVYSYTEQIVDNEFSYTQTILGCACNSAFLYKITIALHLAKIENYMILEPSQILSQLADTRETTLVLDIGYNTYFEIITSEIMENGIVATNIIRANGSISSGTKVLDAALLTRGYSEEEIWQEKLNNTYQDLVTSLNVSYQDIIETVNNEIALFTEEFKMPVTNIVLTGAGTNQEGLEQYLLDNIKGITVKTVITPISSEYGLKLTKPFKDTNYNNLPRQIKTYFTQSYAAYILYNKFINEEIKNEFQPNKLVNYLDSEGKFTGIFKKVTKMQKVAKYLIPISIALLLLSFTIVAEWYVYRNLSLVLDERLATVTLEKSTVTTKLSDVESELATVEQSLLTETYDWSKVLNAVALSTPKGVQITSIETESNNTDIVLIKGYSDSRFKIADMSTLLKDSIFSDAEIQLIENKTTLTKQSIQEFTIKGVGKK